VRFQIQRKNNNNNHLQGNMRRKHTREEEMPQKFIINLYQA